MTNSVRAKLRRAWEVYLIPGYLVGGIKLFSVITWTFGQPVAKMLGLSNQTPSFFESVGTMAFGLAGAVFAMIAWPIAVYMMASGSSSISEMLFYPWVIPAGSVSWSP